MRALALLVWLVAVAVLLMSAFRRGGFGQPRVRDELVKDPVCETYVVRSRAAARLGRGDSAVFFCSDDCARRYAGSIGG